MGRRRPRPREEVVAAGTPPAAGVWRSGLEDEPQWPPWGGQRRWALAWGLLAGSLGLLALVAASVAPAATAGDEPSPVAAAGQPVTSAPAASLEHARRLQANATCSSAFLDAAETGNESELQACLKTEPVNCVDDHKSTPLHYAAQYDQLNASIQLLAAGALMTGDDLGRTPLHKAANAGHYRLTELLLDSVAYVDFADSALRTPLHLAARQGHQPIVRLLLDRSATIDAADGDGRTPLHMASRSDACMNVTKLLCERGAQYEAEDAAGLRPLHLAAHLDQEANVALLLDKRANIYAMDGAGMNPMVHAAAEGHTAVVDVMIIRLLRPHAFPTPDPALVARVRQQGTKVGGVYTWLLALGVTFGGGVLLMIPAACVIRYCARSSKPYHVSGGDVAIEAFVDEVFDYVIGTKGAHEQLFLDFEGLPAHSMNDIHRPRF